MLMKKTLSVLTTIALLSGAVCAVPQVSDGTALFSAPITASAATLLSGVKTGLVYNSACIGTKLYFWQDPSDHHLEVCGCETSGTVGHLTIPSTVKGYPVTGILFHAFDGQTNLYEVNNYSGNIQKIGEGAFLGCTNLKKVHFSNQDGSCSVQSIGNSAFKDCTALENATDCMESAVQIGAHAFWNCTALTEVELHAAESIGEAAFYNCTGVGKIDLSQSALTSLPSFAFFNNDAAVEIHLPETLTTIGMQAFSGCDSLQKIYIPDSVTTIESAAFMSCAALKTVMMSEQIRSIADHAFFNCPSMKFFVSKNANAAIGEWALGWHLENNLPVQNADFRIWAPGSGKVRTYSSDNRFTFRSLKRAPQLAAEQFEQYEWAKSSISVDDWSVNGNYYFNDRHKPYVHASWYDHPYTGFMGAMETVSVLAASGYLPVSDFAPGYDKVRDITSIPQDTISYVSTVNVHVNIMDNDYECEQRFSKEMLRYAEYITYGADAAVMYVRPNNCTMDMFACFGMERKEFADDQNDPCWNGWDARLMVYHPENRTHHNKADYIYVRFSDGGWRIGDISNRSSYTFALSHSPETILLTPGTMSEEAFLAAIRN